MNYKTLGDYIELSNNRNSNLKYEENDVCGVSNDKRIIKSKANNKGRSFEKFYIIESEDFIYNSRTSRMGDKVGLGFNETNKTYITSFNNTAFRVKNELLIPKYLFMWFNRPEFDRYARFHSWGSSTEIFSWEEMCNMELPIPSIEKQQQIVAEYNTVTNRISLNNQLNQKLEETAQTLYKHWFVDFEFPNTENKPYKSSGGEMVYNEELEKDIPVGFSVESIGEIFDIKIGRTPPRNELQWFSTSPVDNIPWVSIKDLGQCDNYLLDTNEYLTKEAIKKFSIPLAEENITFLSFKMSIGKVGITTKKMLSNEAIAHFNTSDKTLTEFIFLFLKQFNFNSLGTTSSIVNSINSKMVKELKFIKGDSVIHKSFHSKVLTIFLKNKNLELQNQKLQEVQSLLLAKMAQQAPKLQTV